MALVEVCWPRTNSNSTKGLFDGQCSRIGKWREILRASFGSRRRRFARGDEVVRQTLEQKLNSLLGGEADELWGAINVFLRRGKEYMPTRAYWFKYHPYRSGGVLNPKFDKWSRLCLDLKESKPAALAYLVEVIAPKLVDGNAIAVVPPHDPSKTDSGIKTLAKMLCTGRRIDPTSARARTIRNRTASWNGGTGRSSGTASGRTSRCPW